MTKLLHISANIYPKLDNKHHHTKNIWKELSKGFDEYHIIARSEDNKYSFSKEGNIYLHLVPRITKKSKIFFLTSFWMFYIIKKYKITHLLSQCPIVGGFNASLASKYFKIPLMVEIHGDVYFDYMKEKKLTKTIFSKITKFTFKESLKIRSLSEKMSQILIENGIDKSKIIVIPNRVNMDLFKSKKIDYSLHNPIKIISIGRFVEQKGYDIAIKAIQNLSQYYNIELYLIGGGKLFDKLNFLKNKYNNIYLIKWIEQDKLKELLEESDIYIQPSKPYFGEAMPRTILEAMAMKLPIIATNIAAIPGILNNNNSILIEPNNIEYLEKAIIKLIENKNLRENIAKQAYQDVVDKYEWNKVFEIYRNELKSMKYENS